MIHLPAGTKIWLAAGVTDTFNAGFTDSNSITYTSSSTLANSQSNSNSASVSISCPSPNWNGPNFVDVYWDGVYGSFVFVLRDLVASDHLLAKQKVAPLTPTETTTILKTSQSSHAAPRNALRAQSTSAAIKKGGTPLIPLVTLLAGGKQSYIANWLEVLKKDTRFIFKAAAHAQRRGPSENKMI